jgi:uracil-DNA glycosylase
LSKLYSEIAEWTIDRQAVPKVIAALNPCARLAIVGEAVGPKTVRLSGVNYFGADGKLGDTGKYLDEMLRSVGFTVYPVRRAKLASGAYVESSPGVGRETVYCTDLCPEFPGRARRRKGKKIKVFILRPTQKRIKDVLKKRFLERELDIVRPKVILLLGSRAYGTFFTEFLKKSKLPVLTAAVVDLRSHLGRYKSAVVIPFLHPSPASPLFQRWFRTFESAPTTNEFTRCILHYLEPVTKPSQISSGHLSD